MDGEAHHPRQPYIVTVTEDAVGAGDALHRQAQGLDDLAGGVLGRPRQCQHRVVYQELVVRGPVCAVWTGQPHGFGGEYEDCLVQVALDLFDGQPHCVLHPSTIPALAGHVNRGHHRREQQAEEDDHDGQHHQDFDKGETVASSGHNSHHDHLPMLLLRVCKAIPLPHYITASGGRIIGR